MRFTYDPTGNMGYIYLKPIDLLVEEKKLLAIRKYLDKEKSQFRLLTALLWPRN